MGLVGQTRNFLVVSWIRNSLVESLRMSAPKYLLYKGPNLMAVSATVQTRLQRAHSGLGCQGHLDPTIFSP